MKNQNASCIFGFSTAIESLCIGSIMLFMGIANISLFGSYSDWVMEDIYLICFIIVDITYIYIGTGTYLLYPTTFTRITLIELTFLLVSIIKFTTSNNKFKDLLYFLSCYVFLVMRTSKSLQVFNHKSLQYKYKIHGVLYFFFIIIQWIINISDMFNNIVMYKNTNIILTLLLIFSKYTIDVIILFKIIHQSLHKPKIANFADIENVVIEKGEIEQLLPEKSESITIPIAENKTNIEPKKIRQRFVAVNKKKTIQTSKANPTQVRSSAKSRKLINEYKGNDKIKNLRSFYKKTYKMNKTQTSQQIYSNENECDEKDDNICKLEEKTVKLQKQTKPFELYVSKKRGMETCKFVPAKPKNINEFIHEHTRKLYAEFLECFGKTRSHYIGICNDYGIEIEFISNNNGNIKGKRIIDFNKMKKIEGNGKIFIDLLWNEEKKTFVDCVCFEYIDEYNGIETKLRLNSYGNEIDLDHLYFEGEYAINNRNIGHFNIICVSIRRRDIVNKRKTFLEYHTDNGAISPYIRCVNDSAQKINILYDKN